MDRTDERASWQVLSKRRIYTSGWINLDLWSLCRPDGTLVTDLPVLDYVRPVVAIIPVGDDGRVLMIEHYRVITGRQAWELPAGRVEPGESVDEAARRELLEETGHSAEAWATLGEYHPSNGSSNQMFHLRIARELTRHSEPTDRNETIALRWVEVQEIRELLRANAIYSGLTITGLCWAMALGVIADRG